MAAMCPIHLYYSQYRYIANILYGQLKSREMRLCSYVNTSQFVLLHYMKMH